MKRLLAVVAAIFAFGLLAGCGDGDGEATGQTNADNGSQNAAAADATGAAGDSGDSTADPAGNGDDFASKREYIATLDQICAEGNKRLQAAYEAYIQEHSGENVEVSQNDALEEVVTTIVIPAMEQQIGDIRISGDPPAGKEQVDAITASMEKSIARAKQEPLGFSQLPRPFEKSEKLAEKYGFVNCGGL